MEKAKLTQIQIDNMPDLNNLIPMAVYYVRNEEIIIETDENAVPKFFSEGIVKRVALQGNELDWSRAVEYVKTLTQNETLTDINLPTGTETGFLIIHLTGDFALTLPDYWQHKGGIYDGTKWNMILADCLNGNSGSEKVNYTILTDE